MAFNASVDINIMIMYTINIASNKMQALCSRFTGIISYSNIMVLTFINVCQMLFQMLDQIYKMIH